MRILVTGGAGFIGSNFVRYWMDQHPNDQMVVLDKLTYAGHMQNLDGYSDRPNFQFVHADICDQAAVAQAMPGVDTVVHFAAESHVDRSLAGLEAEKEFLRTNVEGTLTLLHAAQRAGVSRFHHISTDEVFGDLDYDTPEKFHEDFPYNPHNPYAISKAASDFAVRGFARSHGLPITISNCTNNYGPLQTPEKIIPRAIALLLSGQKIKLYTTKDGVPGPNVRDWLYVTDHCTAIEQILLNGKVGETYCIGGHAEMSNYDLVTQILALMSELTGQQFTMDEHVERVADRPGHDRRYAMDTSKIERELGWRPQHSFASGFKATFDWYLSAAGKAWLESLKDTTTSVRANQDAQIAGA